MEHRKPFKFIYLFALLTIFCLLASQPSLLTRGANPVVVDGFSISGHVTDIGDNPLSGVTIHATKSAYPIVFVHGFRGFPPQFSRCTEQDKHRLTDDSIGRQYFSQVADLLDDYYPVFYAHLVSNPCWTVSIEENAFYLMQSIDRAKAATGASKVILIAHSMGGIISRAYIEGGYYQNDVDTLITFGSPHLGVQVDVLENLVGGWGIGGMAGFCLRWGPAACEFSDLGMAVLNLWYSHRYPGVNYYTISGNAPFYTLNGQGKALDALMLFQPNDGIVKTISGLGLPGVTQSFPMDENHGPFSNNDYHWTYFDARKTIGFYEWSKSYTQCLEPILVTHTADTCQLRLGSAAADRPVSDEPNQRTPLEYATLLPGATLTRTLPMESGAAVFAAGWQTGTVTVTLRTPTGILIDATYATENPSVVSYTVDANNVIYYFPSLDAGEWKMVLQNSSLPISGTVVNTFAALESPLHLSTSVKQDWIQPGVTNIITATLQGAPLSNAWITATLTYEDGSQAFLPLSPLGNGVYQAQFNPTDLPGYTTVSIIASGTINGGDAFSRGADLAFQISPDTITFAGSYEERALPRSPGSAFYGSLVITTSVTTAISGTYGLAADLVDSQGHFVAHSLALAYITAGSGVLPLVFDAADIFAAGFDGPYSLTNLLLTDQSGVPLVVAEAYDVYQTQAYSVAQFGDGKVYLPLAARDSSGGAAVWDDIHESSAKPDALAAYTTVTDANGDYTFTDLPAGTYWVVPSQSDQSFYPAWRPATLPPSASGVNFSYIFEDNFDDGNADGWTPVGEGSWYVENGEYIVDMGSGTSKGGNSFAGNTNWSDYSLFLDVKGDLGVDKVFVFRAITDTDYYYVNIRSSPFNDILLGKYSTILTSASYPNTSGVWYHARIVCIGANIKIYLNDELLIDYFATGSNLITHGRIGLSGWTGAIGLDKVHFDNVKVTTNINLFLNLPMSYNNFP